MLLGTPGHRATHNLEWGKVMAQGFVAPESDLMDLAARAELFVLAHSGAR